MKFPLSPLEIGIALGSNQGDRINYLRTAFSWLKTISIAPVKCSHVYETDPIDCPKGTPFFLNAVCEIKCDMDPLELLHRMRDFERRHGRSEGYLKNAPRPLDLDLLYVGDLVKQMEELILPHPRMLERRFVLQPLCEIRPDLILPNRNQSISQLLASLKDDHEVGLYSESL